MIKPALDPWVRIWTMLRFERARAWLPHPVERRIQMVDGMAVCLVMIQA